MTAPDKHDEAARAWQPIETAPRDNERPLYLAKLSESGEVEEIDFNGSWETESESWEIPQKYSYWASAFGQVEEPTHWAFQSGPPPEEAAAIVAAEERGRAHWTPSRVKEVWRVEMEESFKRGVAEERERCVSILNDEAAERCGCAEDICAAHALNNAVIAALRAPAPQPAPVDCPGCGEFPHHCHCAPAAAPPAAEQPAAAQETREARAARREGDAVTAEERATAHLKALAEEECEHGIEAVGEACSAQHEDEEGEPDYRYQYWCGPCIAKAIIKADGKPVIP